jgi:hypothetical protein
MAQVSGHKPKVEFNGSLFQEQEISATPAIVAT